MPPFFFCYCYSEQFYRIFFAMRAPIFTLFLLWFAWMTSEGGRVRRTVGPRGSYAGPGPQVSGPCRSPALSWLQPKGHGEWGPAQDGGAVRSILDGPKEG